MRGKTHVASILFNVEGKAVINQYFTTQTGNYVPAVVRVKFW